MYIRIYFVCACVCNFFHIRNKIYLGRVHILFVRISREKLQIVFVRGYTLSLYTIKLTVNYRGQRTVYLQYIRI